MPQRYLKGFDDLINSGIKKSPKFFGHFETTRVTIGEDAPWIHAS